MFAIVPDHLGSDLVCVLVFGVLLILLVGFGLKAVDWAWKKLDLEEQVQKGNLAAGVVMAATVLGFCYAAASVVKAIAGTP